MRQHAATKTAVRRNKIKWLSPNVIMVCHPKRLHPLSSWDLSVNHKYCAVK